ncbi:fibrous sheath CABYR-binding protein-like isoform X2 [Cloeon dipterum]|uniref:fibrous sheath CABYR-binding protein-like isoform X2 n=1 Tax=Cloeon dipterum TaxID=197152 RepID=UPI003220A151
MAEFGTAKTVFILAIVVGCFAILWPKIFYPMLLTSLSTGGAHAGQQQDSPLDNQANCCDVIFVSDVTAIKVLTAMCGDILHENQITTNEQLHLSKKSVEKCRDEVLSACGLDITAVIKDQTGLTKSYKQILDEIRSFNNSECLKQNFGVQLSLIGTPRRMRYFPERYFKDKTITARHLRPERPAHLHPEMLHPALREKGRAIPPRPITVASATGMDGSGPRPGYPMPGMRPPMGGAGHVVPAPKGSGTMGIVMPLYTVGIVVFFVYTIMKVLFKRQDDRNKNADFGMDPEIRRMMFGANGMEDYPSRGHRVAPPREVKRPSPEPVAKPAAAPIPAPAPPAPAAPAPEPEQVANGAAPTTNGATPAANGGFRGASPPKSSSKLEDSDFDQLRKRLEETEAAMERIVAQIETAVEPSRPSSSLLKTVPRQGDEEGEEEQQPHDLETVENPVEKDDIVAKEEVIEKENIEATKEEAVVEQEIIKPAQLEQLEAEVTRVAAETKVEEVLLAEEEPIAEESAEPIVEEPIEEEIAKVTSEEEDVKDEEAPAAAQAPERSSTPLQQLLEEGGGKVTVVGMETTARCEDGQKMARPPTPSTPPRSITPIFPLYALEQFTPSPAYRYSRPTTPTSMTPPRSSTPLQRPVSATPPPSHGFLVEGHIPAGGHGILVADSECEATPAADFDYDDFDLDEEAPPVILSGKMTLSVINLPEAIAAEAAAAAAAQAAASHQNGTPVQAADETKAANGANYEEDNGVDEISATNYTTASAAAAEDGAGLEETSADVSGMDDNAEAQDLDEPAAEIEELPRDDASARHNQSNGLQ